MHEYLPVLIVGAIIGVFTVAFIAAYMGVKNKKEALGFDRHIPDGEIIRRLMIYALPYGREFLAVLVIMLASIAYDLASPLIVGKIEELIKDRFEPSALFRWVAVYAGILIVSMVCTYLQSIILQKTGQKILSALRQDLFTHIESLSHDQLNKIPVGKLVTRVANDTNAISMVFTNVLVNMARNAFIVLGVLGAMLLLNYALTLMILCFVPFLVLFTVIFRKFTRKVHRVVKDRTTDLNTFLSENLSGIKITQIFNQEERKLGDFLSKSDALKKAKQNQIFVFGIFRPMVYMLYVSSILCLFYLGGKGYIQDTVFLGQVMTSGTIVSFYMYISKFFNPIQTLAEQFNMLQSAFASAEKIFSVFDLEPEVADAPDAVELDHIRGEIEFEDVWFAYEPGEWVLKGVSFHVDARQTAAFVGATGSGKTTILSLICRNYDIQKGRILIDGQDIRTIKLSSLRRQFGQMLQDVFLFSGTIRSNIVLREDTGVSTQIFHYLNLQPADVNGDGAMEAPRPVRLLSETGEDAYWKIYWHSYRADGADQREAVTYHNQADGWYLLLPEGWEDHFTVRQNNISSAVHATTFYSVSGWTMGEELLTIYTLTGTDRENQAAKSGRTILRRRGETIYAISYAKAYENWRYAVDGDTISESFKIITKQLSMGEN